ncbi:MAG: hypothetical protein R3F39_07625 [Myxococcota bacterium]
MRFSRDLFGIAAATALAFALGCGSGTPSAGGPDAEADASGTDGASLPDAPDVAGGADLLADAPLRWDAKTPGCVSGEAGCPDVVEPTGSECQLVDAGDEAWVRRAVQSILGRKPVGVREVVVLTEMVQAVGRRKVALALTHSDGYVTRWAQWLQDEVRVDRMPQAQKMDCFGPPLLPDDAGELSAWLRDRGPEESYAKPFNMGDAMRSALRADDISVFYRVNLFPMLVRPLDYCVNVDPNDMERARRLDMGERYASIYMHRTVSCLGCHSATFAVTDSEEAAKDHHWPLPGIFEENLYGDDFGRPELEVFAPLRFDGVVSRKSLTDNAEVTKAPADSGPTETPWGMISNCGEFIVEASITPDPLKTAGYFVEPQTATTNVRELERLLREGVDELAKAELPRISDENVLTGRSTLAYLLAARVTNQVFEEVYGRPLTMGHGFARNRDQRDTHLRYIKTLVQSGWSLRTLLAEMLAEPWAALVQDDATCANASPYALPPIFEPFSVEEEEPDVRGNGVGDLVHRVSGRVLVSMTTEALDWPPTSEFPDSLEALALLRTSGTFVDDLMPASRGIDLQRYIQWEGLTRTCRSLGGAPTADRIDAIVEAVETSPGATLGDALSALKDVLLTAPAIDPEEAAALAEYLSVPSLDVPPPADAELDALLRSTCGLLLITPQFLLEGAPQPVGTDRPLLKLPGSDRETLCASFIPAMAAAGTTMTCLEGSPSFD